MKKKSNRNSPKVSVIIPSYNHERYVGGAIESVLAQTFEHFELVIIDDGSTDGSVKLIEGITDKRIRFYTQLNQGAAKTINRGIGLARGKYISVLNSDDLYHPDRLMKMSSFLDKNLGQMLVSSLIQPIDASGEKVTGRPEYDEWLSWYDTALNSRVKDDSLFISLLKYNFIVSTSNIFMRSSIFDHEDKFSALLNYCHDYELLLRVSSKYPVAMLEEKLLNYRLHEKNTIRENEFLRHIEVVYTLFKTGDWERMLAKRSIRKREQSPLFKGLSNNPELNFTARLEALQKTVETKEHELIKADVLLKGFRSEVRDAEESIGKLQNRLKDADGLSHQLQMEVGKRDAKLEWVDGYLKDLHRLLSEKDTRLAKADREIVDLTAVISNKDQELSNKDQELLSIQQEMAHQQVHVDNQQTQLETKDLLLREIFASKGWLWLTRFRRIKQKLKLKKAVLPEMAEDGTDDKTYHVKLLHSVQKNRPRVMHAIANFMTGGSSRLVVDLIEHLGHKYDQEVVTSFIPPLPAYSGLTIHDFSGPRKAEEFSAFFKKKKPDIVHVHYWGDVDAPWYEEVFAAAADYRSSVIENVNTPVAPFIDDGVDRYVYVSKYAMHYTSPVADKSSVIYPGSNLDMFKRNNRPIADDVIGMVYRLEKDKLREDSIQVFIDVVKSRPETKAVIIGGGSFLESYERQVADQGVADSFEFTGWVSYEQLPEHYRRLSVFVAPVWKESFGQVSPFAMGMEIPVAGYNIGALSEILGSDECLGANRKELADIIIHLLNNREERLKIGVRNRNQAVNNFSLKAMVTQYDQLYDSFRDDK